MPKYVSYESYRNQTDTENAEENAFESLLDDAKHQMTKGSQRLGTLINVPESARMCELMPTA